jgi:hypothetical protein
MLPIRRLIPGVEPRGRDQITACTSLRSLENTINPDTVLKLRLIQLRRCGSADALAGGVLCGAGRSTAGWPMRRRIGKNATAGGRASHRGVLRSAGGPMAFRSHDADFKPSFNRGARKTRRRQSLVVTVSINFGWRNRMAVQSHPRGQGTTQQSEWLWQLNAWLWATGRATAARATRVTQRL